jgi:ABC-type cobalamin/Fe3+-siderophores transport system ATPase subunit
MDNNTVDSGRSAQLPGLSSAAPRLSYRATRLAEQRLVFSAEFGPALHGVVLPSRSYSQTFVACTLGIEFPARGKIVWGEEEPASSPKLRARLGGLLPTEPALPGRGNVEAYVNAVLAIRAGENVTGELDIGHIAFCAELRQRQVSDLSPHETRKVALGLALALEAPSGLVLYEPLRGLTGSEAGLVLGSLKSQTEKGALVLTVSSELAGVVRTSSRVHYLQPKAAQPLAQVHFLVRTDNPSEAADLLAGHEAVIATRVDPNHKSDLYVEVVGEESGATALLEALYATSGSILEVRRVASPLSDGVLP